MKLFAWGSKRLTARWTPFQSNTSAKKVQEHWGSCRLAGQAGKHQQKDSFSFCLQRLETQPRKKPKPLLARLEWCEVCCVQSLQKARAPWVRSPRPPSQQLYWPHLSVSAEGAILSHFKVGVWTPKVPPATSIWRATVLGFPSLCLLNECWNAVPTESKTWSHLTRM